MYLFRGPLLALFGLVAPAASQDIWDVWQTTWDRGRLFSSVKPSTPFTFGNPSGIGQADISVNDGQTFQSIWGFGGSLTDSSAKLLKNLKSTNNGNYNSLLNYLFSPTDGANAAGLNYIRVPLGASDFADRLYTFDANAGDTDFSEFNINAAPSYLFEVLNDIKNVNSLIKVHLVPWSPPAWMKDSGSMNGGSLQAQYRTVYATYLLKCLQGFRDKIGINPYAISIQNEPQNSNPTYPTATLTPTQEAEIGNALRSLMNSNGFGGTKLIGFDHNWNSAGSYAIQLMQASNVFDGVAFHCYSGTVSQQDTFHNAYPNKEIYFTECSGTIGSDWWSDIKWYMDNIFIGAVQRNAGVGLMWNIALDGNGQPMLPGTNSCGGGSGPGCRGIVQINSDGSWSVNQEFYAMAQVSKAIIPRDTGGPFGKRIGVSVGGELSWALRVGAFVTERRSGSTEWSRYSLVVLNWDDRPNGSWNPTPVRTTIEFRGKQAVYTFPVGVTTLWWYAARPSLTANDSNDNSTTTEVYEAYAETDGRQTPIQLQFTRDELRI